MGMRVMKFGGTSVATAERVTAVAEIVKSALPQKPVVVVSAVAGTTDLLKELAETTAHGKRQTLYRHIRATHRKLLSELHLDPRLLDAELKQLEILSGKTQKLTPRVLDAFLSFGERLSAPIVAAALNAAGVRAEAFPAWEVGMITDDNFGKAEPLPSSYALLKKTIRALGVVPVVTGYIGKTERGAITTMSRGGSDYTAAILGAALRAERIQVWKEVDGVMTADPRLVPEAKVIPELAFEEVAELSYFGAKVLHPKAILPAMKKGIPVQVLNTLKPEGAGTTIVSSFAERQKDYATVEALTFKKNMVALYVYSPEFFDGSRLMAYIFGLFAKHRLNFDVVTTAVTGVTLVVEDDARLGAVIRGLKKAGLVTAEWGKAIICAVGANTDAAGVAGRMFTALEKGGIPVETIVQAASGVSITFVVEERNAERALSVLHSEYIKI